MKIDGACSSIDMYIVSVRRMDGLKPEDGSSGTELVTYAVPNDQVLGMSTAMKPRESALRLKRFDATEKARKVADLESMIREFEQMAVDLERQISTEEDRTGIRDPKHFSYSTFAKAAAQRRDNLRTSIDDLRAKLTLAQRDRDNALEDLTKVEGGEPRDTVRNRRRAEAGSDARIG